MNYKKGDKCKFGFAKGKNIDEVIDCDFNWTHEAIFGVCPNCGEKLSKIRTFNIVRLMSIDNGKHFIGLGKDGFTLKLEKKVIPKKHFNEKGELVA